MQRISGLRNVASSNAKGVKPHSFGPHIRHASQRAPAARRSRISEDHAPVEDVQTTSNPHGGVPKSVWAVTAVMGTVLGFYTLQIYHAVSKPCMNPNIASLSEQRDVSGRYEDTADDFDSEVGFSEWLMGINTERMKLASQCRGHVLEVSCGTGRNLGYYDVGPGGKVDSLTFVDLSPQMVEVCKKKWIALYRNSKASWFSGRTAKSGLTIRFVAISALGKMPLAPTQPPRKYDTVIQTMGLCSTPSPVELLQNMAQYVDTSNPDSRIMLLEHGRSYQQWLNRVLDNSSEKHAEIHGCWFNREIGTIVEEAADKTGFEVVKERRHHLGTTWVFELKPKAETVERQRALLKEAVQVATSAASEPGIHPEPVHDPKPSNRWIAWK